MYDILIVGGGPAGLTAAIYGLRAGKTVLVVEKGGFGGQIAFSPKVENIPGTKLISGAEFADQLTEQAMALGADVELETVTGVEKLDGFFRVETEEGSSFEAKAVILALGVKHRMLGLPGEEELIGHGISFCAVCDGAFYEGQEVAMIGGGNSALQEALLLSEVCKKVTVVQNLADFTGEKKLAELLIQKENVQVYFSTVVAGYKSENGDLTGLRLHNEVSGEEFDLEDHRGQVVVLNFWYTECSSCVKELPHFYDVAREYGDKLTIIAIHVEQSYMEGKVTDWINTDQRADPKWNDGTMLIGWDDGLECQKGFGIQACPVTVVIDGDGVITSIINGGMKRQELVDEVEKALNN